MSEKQYTYLILKILIAKCYHLSHQWVILVTSNITDHYKKYNNEKVWNIAEITKMWQKETRNEQMLLGKQVRQTRVAINTQFAKKKYIYIYSYL